MKHTPGPWDKIQHREGDSRVGAKTLIAIVYSEAYKDTENQKANANLIAAAPDLLEAAQQALRILESMPNEGSTYGVLERAIDKAKGRSL